MRMCDVPWLKCACRCVRVSCFVAKSLSSPFFHFSVSQLTIRQGERERVGASDSKSTLGLSKWFKRDVRGLQHMVGSDFLMQIGKDQIKAA